MTTEAALVALARIDLHDEAAVELWTDATLERHLAVAVDRYSSVNPLQTKTTLSTTAGSRDVSVSSLAYHRIVAVEWPTDENPRRFLPWSLWADIITLDVETQPSAIEDIDVYWNGKHTVNGASSWPLKDDDLIVLGTVGYAALEWANFAANRVNVAGAGAWGHYQQMGQDRLADFERRLALLPAANQLRTGTFFTPERGAVRSQSTDPGP